MFIFESIKKHLKILIVIAIFFILQLQNADYGHRINDYSYLSANNLSKENFVNQSSRNSIVEKNFQSEDIEKWLLRFNLYSINADEMLNIMALSRISPSEFKFDPHYYSYGGGYLYPLGTWYFILDKIGLIDISNMDELLKSPQVMDSVYRFGRAFVLFFYVLSVLVFYKIFRLYISENLAIYASMLLLLMPASIMFSIVIKPYAFSLFWISLSLYVILRASRYGTFSNIEKNILALFLGVSVGSVVTNILFVAICWLYILLIFNNFKEKKSYLIKLPFIVLIYFLVLNPYVILNFDSFSTEFFGQTEWFKNDPKINFDLVYLISDFLNQGKIFFLNSLVPGFGASLLILYAFTIFSSGSYTFRTVSFHLLFFLLIFSFGFLLKNINEWHINSRYVMYLPPIILVFCIFYLRKLRYFANILKILVGISFLQSAPMIVAYHDEDDVSYSTRMLAADWLNKKNVMVCPNNSISPYDFPPINLKKLATLDKIRCKYLVGVIRRPDNTHIAPVGYTLEKEFVSRFNIKQIPLVYSHVNPTILIFRRDE